MIPALLATLLFCGSILAAKRAVHEVGDPLAANLIRILLATGLLGIYLVWQGLPVAGGATLWFIFSGVVGFGLGDIALFQALSRLGSRLTILLSQCLAVPFAALLEWFWLNTLPGLAQFAAALVILSGVTLAISPDRNHPPRVTNWFWGSFWGVVAGLGQGWGAVISRHAFALAESGGAPLDGVGAAFLRLLGGAVLALPVTLLLPGARQALVRTLVRPVKPQAIRWCSLNALAGPSLGVACYQWALMTTPGALVLAVVATAPVWIAPLTRRFENDRPGPRAWLGTWLAISGVIALIFLS